jgi:hypothetical protein
MAEMLKTLAAYGCVQGRRELEAASGEPPIQTRKSCDATLLGCIEWLIHS